MQGIAQKADMEWMRRALIDFICLCVSSEAQVDSEGCQFFISLELLRANFCQSIAMYSGTSALDTFFQCVANSSAVKVECDA